MGRCVLGRGVSPGRHAAGAVFEAAFKTAGFEVGGRPELRARAQGLRGGGEVLADGGDASIGWTRTRS